MDNKLVSVLEQIMELAAEALAYVKRERARVDKIIKFVIPKKDNENMRVQKLPPNVRRFRDGYQGRKMLKGTSITVYADTPQECADKLRLAVETAKSAVADVSNCSPNMSFAEFWDVWYTTYKVPKLSKNSLYQIRNVFAKHIPDWLKAKPLVKLTSLDIQKALNGVESDRMREYARNEYSDCLGWAYKLDLLHKDIMRLVPATYSERKTGKALTLDEQAEFLKRVDALPNELYHVLFRVYLLTGARPAEALLLTAKDFDYVNNRVHIPGTKNLYSDRYIPFFDALHEVMDKWLPEHSSGLLFPFKRRTINGVMKRIYPWATTKDLRHTFATRCKECGIPTDVYKQWLGHSKSSTVAETTYTHYDTVFTIEAQKFSLVPPNSSKEKKE